LLSALRNPRADKTRRHTIRLVFVNFLSNSHSPNFVHNFAAGTLLDAGLQELLRDDGALHAALAQLGQHVLAAQRLRALLQTGAQHRLQRLLQVRLDVLVQVARHFGQPALDRMRINAHRLLQLGQQLFAVDRVLQQPLHARVQRVLVDRHGLLRLGHQLVDQLVGAAQQEAVLQPECLAVGALQSGIVALEQVLHLAHHRVRSLGVGFEAGRRIEHRKGDHPHRVVALQGVDDVAVALQRHVVAVHGDFAELVVDLQRLGQQPGANVAHQIAADVEHLEALIAADGVDEIVQVVFQLVLGYHQFGQWEFVLLDQVHQGVHDVDNVFQLHAGETAGHVERANRWVLADRCQHRRQFRV
jgi:hypothetical protein